jgi:hypothetical protein
MEILTILVAVFGMAIVGLLVFFAYRQGIIDGQKLKEEKPVKISTPKENKKPVIPDEIIDGYNNIMNYDGKERK